MPGALFIATTRMMRGVATPACLMMKLRVPMVRMPVRGPSVLAATEKATALLPPEVMVSQLALPSPSWCSHSTRWLRRC